MPKLKQSATPLERNAEKIYQVLRALGEGWHGRTAIARQMGRRQLTPGLISGLEFLVTSGRVIAERHEIPDSPIPVRWEYKIAIKEAKKLHQ